MKTSIHAVVLVVLLVSWLAWPESVVAVDQLRLSRKIAHVFKQRRPEPRPGEGLLIADFRPIKGEWRDEEPFIVELSPSLGGAARTFEARVGSASVVSLHAGRYCLTAIVKDGKRYPAACDGPFFDVSADSLDFTGRVEFKLGWGRANVTWRAVDAGYLGPPLTDEQRARITGFLDAASARGTRTFLLSSPPGYREIFRLFADGSAEAEGPSLLNSSYSVYVWSMDGKDIQLGPKEYPAMFRLTPVTDGWQGVEFAVSQTPTSEVHYDVIRRLAVSTRAECWHWQRCGSRWTEAVVMYPEYEIIPNAKQLRGRIELEFGLVPDAAVAKADAIHVVSSSLTPGFDAKTVEFFADTIFALPPNLSSDQRFRQVVEFEQKAYGLEARTGELKPVPR